MKSRNIAAKAIKARNLARNAVKAKSIAPNAVTAAKIQKGAITAAKVQGASLGRANLAAGTLAGLQVAEIQAAAVPGFTTDTPSGTAVPVTGTAAFTPVAGKSYELLTELKGTPTDSDGAAGPQFCAARVMVLVNGVPVGFAGMWNDASEPAAAQL